MAGRPRADSNKTPTVERIHRTARAEFAARGYGDARLEDIARAAGIRRPSLLYHFGSKERLYAAVIETAFGGLAQALERAMTGPGDFRARLDALVSGYLAFLSEDPSFAPLVLREVLDGHGPGRDLILAQVVPLLDQLEQFIEQRGAGALRAGLPIRGAILQLAMATLVRAASGPLRDPLWGKSDPLPELARLLLLAD